MRERSMVKKMVLGILTCLLLVAVYSAGTVVARSASSSGTKTQIGHMVEGDPLAGLELDSSQYGTETPVERKAIGDCYESAVGARAPEELPTPTFDELYAWRECAVELGIESKVMMIESASEDERQALAENANTLIRKQMSCLKDLGWRIVPLPDSAEGIEQFEVDAKHEPETERRLAADSASCGVDSGEGHDH